MTPEEKLEIVSAVLENIKVFSTTILQMTEVTSVPTDAYVELNGGRKISVQTLINEAVTRALAAANITALNQRMAALSDEVARNIRSLGNAIEEIPVVYVDDALSTSSENPVQNKVIAERLLALSELSEAFMHIPWSEAITNCDFGASYREGDQLVMGIAPQDSIFAGETIICMYRPSTGSYYNSWYGHPVISSDDEAYKVSHVYTSNGQVWQGSGNIRPGIIPLGAMLAQHNILEQQQYDALSDVQKDEISLYMTY